MDEPNAARYGLAITPLILVAGCFLALSGPSERLLSPAPTQMVPVAMLVALGIALFASFTLLRDVESRFLRRMVTLLLFALTLFACGVSGRGLYAVMAFRGPVTTFTEQWAVDGFIKKDGALSISRAGLSRAMTLPASPEAVAAVTGVGSCIAIKIERTPSGVERMASDQPTIGLADLKRCAPSSFSDGAAIPFSRSESPADRASADAIRATNQRLLSASDDNEAEDKEHDRVSFEPGEPMIDTTPRGG
jgi:hypothetical protein